MTATSKKRWTLLFEPLGVLMFRDHRPFDAGQHVMATSQFPLPSVFRGAVRSALFVQAGADFRKREAFGLTPRDTQLLGGPTQPEAFELRGPIVLRAVGESYEYVLPWPRDLAVTRKKVTETGVEFEAVTRRPRQASGPFAPACLRLGPPRDRTRELEPLGAALPWGDQSLSKSGEHEPWLTAAGARYYAQHEHHEGPLTLVEGQHWLEQRGFLAEERRVGIARDTQSVSGSLTAAESMFYILRTLRVASSFRFGVEVELDLDAPLMERAMELLRGLNGALLRLGGRSQHARVELVEHELSPQIDLRPQQGARSSSKLWLWTPGLFDPAKLADEAGLRGALASTVRVGGFDMAQHRPRPLTSALGSGSVLWFSDPDLQAIAAHQQTYAQTHEHPARGGYGRGLWIPTPTSNSGSDA